MRKFYKSVYKSVLVDKCKITIDTVGFNLIAHIRKYKDGSPYPICIYKVILIEECPPENDF